jgi:RNA polymerase sigma-70 factor (ECF subfamily)
MYRARSQFRVGGNIGAWARRIATNLAIDHLRSKRPEQGLPGEVARADAPDALLQRETREKIREAFRRLPAKLQVAASLALIEERPYEEIAEALGTSACAVKLRVFRAVRLLRKQLQRLGVRP